MMASVNHYYCLAEDQLCKVLSKVSLTQQSFKACALPYNTLENKALSVLFPFCFQRSPPTVLVSILVNACSMQNVLTKNLSYNFQHSNF